MAGRYTRVAWMVVMAALCASSHAQGKSAKKPPAAQPAVACRAAVIEGTVKRGESFQALFAGTEKSGLVFMLEAIHSGWIVRVLPAGEPRGPHDYAELASPPYQSVTPLAVSTDFSFRAQDAIAWNPRRFRYAKNAVDFHQLEAMYPAVMANDGSVMSRLAELVATEPGAELDILDATLAPGTADQWRMAAAVASHLANTPHEEAQGIAPTPLGEIESMRFRVVLDLPSGMQVAKSTGVNELKISCAARPTV